MWAVCRHQNRKKISTKILTRFFVCFLSNLTIWQPCVTMLTDGQDNSSLPYHKTLIYSCRCHAVVDKILKRSYEKKKNGKKQIIVYLKMALKQRKMSCALQYCSSSDNTNGYLVITNPKFTPDIYQLDSIDCGERVLMRGLALDIFNQRFVLKIFLAAAHM